MARVKYKGLIVENLANFEILGGDFAEFRPRTGVSPGKSAEFRLRMPLEPGKSENLPEIRENWPILPQKGDKSLIKGGVGIYKRFVLSRVVGW